MLQIIRITFRLPLYTCNHCTPGMILLTTLGKKGPDAMAEAIVCVVIFLSSYHNKTKFLLVKSTKKITNK